MSRASASVAPHAPASAGGGGGGARAAAAAHGQPLHKIWGRLEDLSAGDGSRSSNSSEQVVRSRERLPEGVEVVDNSDTSLSNSREKCSPASGGLPPDASAGPGPGDQARVGGARGSGSRAPAGAPRAETSGKLSRQARAQALFGVIGGAPLPSEVAATAAPGGVRKDQYRLCYDQELHDSGQCRPCHYFVKKGGCAEKDACGFCHLEHEATRRLRPCKVKRERCKNMVEALASGADEVMHRLGEISERSSLQGSYVRTVLATKVKPQ